MPKYASCSKILEDTRALESGYASRPFYKALRVPALEFGSWIIRAEVENFTSGIKEVCVPGRYMSIQKGGFMINNMVLSREIEWIGYEHKRNMLQVEFIVGATYQYENVPETVYQEFLTAPSHGRFFESNIKNKYQTRKVR